MDQGTANVEVLPHRVRTGEPPAVAGRIGPREVAGVTLTGDEVQAAILRELRFIREAMAAGNGAPVSVTVNHYYGAITEQKGEKCGNSGFSVRAGGESCHSGAMNHPVATHGAERPGGLGMDVLQFPAPQHSPIAESIEAWAADMRRRGCAPASVKRFTTYAAKCAEHNGWREVQQVDYAGASAWLGHMREHGGWGGTTHDQGVSALRVWGRWLHKAKLTPDNPLEHLEASGEQGDDGSRALTTEEARAMIRTAIERGEKDGRAKGNRALFWAFLCLTGLRTAEAERCRWGDIDLDGDPPAIYTDPAWSKNGKRMRVVLNDEIAALLRTHRRTVPDAKTDRVFPVAPNRASWRKIRELAGVKAEDARGRAASPHSCRKWLATELDRTGTSAGVVSRILRHAGSLAEQRYIDPEVSAEVAAVQRLPRIWQDCSQGYTIKIATKTGQEGLRGDEESDRLAQATPSDSPDCETIVPCTASQSDRAFRPGMTGSESLPGRSLPGREAPSETRPVRQDVVTGSFESSPVSEIGNGHFRPRNDGRTQVGAGTAPAVGEGRQDDLEPEGAPRGSSAVEHPVREVAGSNPAQAGGRHAPRPSGFSDNDRDDGAASYAPTTGVVGPADGGSARPVPLSHAIVTLLELPADARAAVAAVLRHAAEVRE